MNEKIHKLIMLISVCLASFCVAAVVAVLIVDSKASQINLVPEKPHYNGVSFSEKITPENEKTEETASPPESADDAPFSESKEITTYNIETKNHRNTENTPVKSVKALRPSPKEVIKSIPLSEKTKILRKYLPKLTAQDIKYFTSLLKEKNPDFENAKKRIFEIYTPEEITELYNIYKSYEEKIYESYS